MKFVFAPDSFKGTLSSERMIQILSKKAKEIFPGIETAGVPIADGGEGTLDAVMHSAGGKRKKCMVTGPLMQPVEAEYLILDDRRVLIEMAKASGITLIPYAEGNALKTTSYGTGELIRDALESGYRDITISIGGSATNDGGIGMLEALGIKFYDKDNHRVVPVGENLGNIFRIDMTDFVDEIKDAEIRVMCDVRNPLLGENGATYVFGPQKGASEAQLAVLEKGMEHYASLLEETCGQNVSGQEGAGAAGGMGAALMAFCHAKLQSGIRTILDLIHFDTIIQDADLIISGEGRVDGQSACGKVLDGIGSFAMEKSIPLVVITGGMGKGAQDVYRCGIESIMVTENGPMSLEDAISNAEILFEDAADRMFRLIKTGMKLKM